MSSTHRLKTQRLEAKDDYPTPPALASACIKVLIADGWIRSPEATRVLEPSCGRGAWVRAMIAQGFDPESVYVNDIREEAVRACPAAIPKGNRSAIDFLLMGQQNFGSSYFDLVAGNPPFSDTGAHIEAGMDVLAANGILAYLLQLNWFTARGKEDSRIRWIWGLGRPSHFYLISPRPSFTEGGTDSGAYCLAVWAPGTRGRDTTFSMLDWAKDRDEWSE